MQLNQSLARLSAPLLCSDGGETLSVQEFPDLAWSGRQLGLELHSI